MAKPQMILSWLKIAIFCWFVVVGAFAQLPEPEPQADDFNLELRQEAGGLAVRMQDFFGLMNSMFKDAQMRWDPTEGVLRVQQAGHNIAIRSRTQEIVIDGRAQRTARPVLIRQGSVLLPVETVEMVLHSLGVDFEYNTPAKVATPTPLPTLTPVPLPTLTPSPTPSATPSPTASPAAAQTAEPAATPEAKGSPTPRAASGVLESELPMPVPGADAVGLQAPAQLGADVDLSWGQLADAAHRRPPRTVLIIHDTELKALAERATAIVNESGVLQAEPMAVPDARRDHEALVASIAGRRPDLVLDLMAVPSGPGDNRIAVWTVHQALWPQDGQGNRDDPARRYRRHQFQNLALGSVLNAHLEHEVPQGRPKYELAPLYVGRRIDAPSAAVLVPSQVVTMADADAQGVTTQERIARALAAAVGEYRNGMAGVQF